MVLVKALNYEAVNFDSSNFDSEFSDAGVENNNIAAEKRILKNVAKNMDTIVVVVYMNFGCDSATEVVDNSVDF